MTLRWPCMLGPNDIEVDLTPRPQGGGPSIAGGSQWVQSEAGVWEITYSSIPTSRLRINAYRMIALLLNGPATPILVPVFDKKRAPFPFVDPTVGGPRITSYGDIPHSDDSLFSDGSGYYTPVIDATAAAAAIRSTSLTMTLNYGGMIWGGEFFSIGENLYEIKSVSLTDAGPPGVYEIGFMPPLRVAITDGTVLNFDDPVCRCTLASSSGMPLSLSNRIVGLPAVSFIEDFSGSA